MSHKYETLARLERLGVPCRVWEHAPAPTMEDCLRLPYAEPDVTFCKNILLCNRQQTAFYLYVTLPDKPFRTGVVSKLLGSSRLSFAPEEALDELFQVQTGSLSPLALWFDKGRRVRLAIDEGVRRTGRIAFHPCDNTATVIFDQDVFWQQVLPALSPDPVWLET